MTDNIPMAKIDYPSLRQKIAQDRAKLEAEIAERARAKAMADEDAIDSLPLSRSDRLLLQAGFTPGDLLANDAMIAEAQARRDRLFEEQREVPASRQSVIDLPNFIPTIRTWDDPSEYARRRQQRKGK